MRLIVDGVIALMLVIVLGSVLLQQRARTGELRRVEATQRAVRAIISQALYRGTLPDADVTRRGYPWTIEQTWFDEPPANLLAHAAGGWLDVASEDQAQTLHPPQITTADGACAFWYNPYRGVVRARVAMQASDQATIELYNLVNGSSLRPDAVRRTPDRN